ncbi:MAG TPA: hypothetical protein P5107_02265 [Thermotogota bacterium]|nr:hypothetical protein [Thermotogota bacterium]HRW33861.1 hypothetical protein [Thermotogota bacterium]
MSILSVLGAVFLIILAFKMFPAIIGILVAIGAVVLVGLIFAGILVVFLPVLIIILAVAGLIWLIKTLIA